MQRTWMGLILVLTFAGLAISSCQSDQHKMTESAPGKKSVCTQCYDHMTTIVRTKGSGTHTDMTHACPGCKSEMSVYTGADGVMMMKCAGCAPAGVACDKCQPRDPK